MPMSLKAMDVTLGHIQIALVSKALKRSHWVESLRVHLEQINPLFLGVLDM